MALKKLRFVWHTPPLPDGRWRLGLFNFQQISDPGRPLPGAGVPAYWKNYLHHALHISLRGLLAWGAAGAALAYLAAVGVIHLRQERANPHNRVGYLDLALPTRWDRLPRLRGEGFILLARDKLAAGRFQEGFTLLRLGVEKNPADSAARLELARLYLALRLRPQAEKLLLDGLDAAYPGRDYTGFVLALAAEADQPDARVALCERVRASFDRSVAATTPGHAAEALRLDQETATALLAARRPDEALALVRSRYPETDAFRREISILALLDRGDTAAALATAEAWAADPSTAPTDPVPLRLLVRARREAGDHAGMDTALARLRAQDPARPDALLYALAQNHLAGRPARADAALADLLFRHGANPTLYPALAGLLAELGLEKQLAALETELRDRGLSPRPVLIARLQLEVEKQDWSSARATAGEIRADTARDPLSPAQENWLAAMEGLAAACADGGSGVQAALVERIADQPGTLRLYRLLIESLLAADRLDTAAQILALAEGPFPAARGIVAARAEIEARRAAAPVAPGDDAVEPTAEALPASPEALRSELDRRIREGDTEGAFALLAALRRDPPAWAGQARLDAMELPLRARADDPLRMQFLARAVLAHDGEAARSLLALARELHAEDRRATALLLLKEILRRDPADAEALAQLAVWEPRPAGGPVDVAP